MGKGTTEEPAAGAALPGLPRGALAGRAVRSLAVTWLPALAALLVLRFLVPPESPGFPGAVARLGRAAPLPFGAALFLLFSALARHWWGRLAAAPGSASATARSPLFARSRGLGGLLATILVAALAGFAWRAHGPRPYRVLGESMLPTLEPGDLVAGESSRGAAIPRHRGDVVVLRAAAVLSPKSPAAPTDMLVKRVLALAGDVVTMQGGTPVINGWRVPSCDAGDYLYVLRDGTERALHGRLRVEFLGDRSYLTVHGQAAPFSAAYRVPPGEVFVLGDDRGSSVDSRSYGGVPLAAIESRIDRFLLGTYRNGDADFARLLRPIDALQIDPRLEGVATESLVDGVRRCLAQRPSETSPPPPEPL